MGGLWKDFEPFIGLVGTSILLFVNPISHENDDESTNDSKYQGRKRTDSLDKATLDRKRKIMLAVLVGLFFGFCFLCGLLVFFNIPSKLRDTHEGIAQIKKDSRIMCRLALDQDDYLAAEDHIRDNKLSKELWNTFQSKQRKNIARTLQPIANQFFYRTGAFCSVLPIFVVYIIQILFGLAGKPIPKKLPTTADWNMVLIPIMKASIALTWVANFGFHFWLRERQVTSCMLISGHWYTFVQTSFCFLAIFLFLQLECSTPRTEKLPGGKRNWTYSGSLLPYYFISWFILYLALSVQILSASQQFHHDSFESVAGIKSSLMVLPFGAIAAVITLRLALGNAEVVVISKDQDEDQDVISKEHKMKEDIIKPGSICTVLQEFQKEDEGEISVQENDVIQVLSEDQGGWIQIENVDGLIGYIPYAFICETPFKKFEKKKPKQDVKQQQQPNKPKVIENVPKRQVPNFLNDIKKGNVKLHHTKPTTTTQPSSGGGGGSGGLMEQLQARLEKNRAMIDPPQEELESDEWN